MKKTMIAGAVGAFLALGAGSAMAAAPDWGKVEATDITLFYPGVSPLEWIQKGTEHGGARGLKKDETCGDCHSFESMNKDSQKQRARKQHEMALEDNMTCIDCHKGIAHHKPEGMTEEDEE